MLLAPFPTNNGAQVDHASDVPHFPGAMIAVEAVRAVARGGLDISFGSRVSGERVFACEKFFVGSVRVDKGERVTSKRN